MAHHLGIASLPGPLFTIPNIPGATYMSPIPPAFDDIDHKNGMTLEPSQSTDPRPRRACWNFSNGKLARLVSQRR